MMPWMIRIERHQQGRDASTTAATTSPSSRPPRRMICSGDPGAERIAERKRRHEIEHAENAFQAQQPDATAGDARSREPASTGKAIDADYDIAPARRGRKRSAQAGPAAARSRIKPPARMRRALRPIRSGIGIREQRSAHRRLRHDAATADRNERQARSSMPIIGAPPDVAVAAKMRAGRARAARPVHRPGARTESARLLRPATSGIAPMSGIDADR